MLMIEYVATEKKNWKACSLSSPSTKLIGDPYTAKGNIVNNKEHVDRNAYGSHILQKSFNCETQGI